MTKRVNDKFKQLLIWLGIRLSPTLLYRVQGVVNYLQLGRWLADHHFETCRRVPDRETLFATLAETLKDRQVLYLEFGVARGYSMRIWSKALENPAARLHGFDSFYGLPEDWDAKYPKGKFSTQGKPPVIDDPRVQFYVGWFNEVLPNYSVPAHEVLFINMDADLYTSSVYVLRHLRPWIKPGTFIYFDDLGHPNDEPRAFHEFMNESGLKVHIVCVAATARQACFQCVS